MIIINNLNKSYKTGNKERQLLKNINFEIHDGDFLIIMGESGCGKTTLLNCISGFDKIDSGEILVDNENPHQLKSKKQEEFRLHKFGFIFQDNYLIDNLTLLENVAMSRLQYDPNAYEKAEDLLKQVHILALKEHYPSQASGGEKQRCAIARALINEPTILFADEPTAALDKVSAKETMEILSSLNKQGQTILLVTHSETIATYGTRFILIDDGSFKVDKDMKEMNIEERLSYIQKVREEQ